MIPYHGTIRSGCAFVFLGGGDFEVREPLACGAQFFVFVPPRSWRVSEGRGWDRSRVGWGGVWWGGGTYTRARAHEACFWKGGEGAQGGLYSCKEHPTSSESIQPPSISTSGWPRDAGVCTSSSSPRFLPSIFIAHKVRQSHCLSTFHRVLLLAHALLALSASQFLR